jgi:hypothetical protein
MTLLAIEQNGQGFLGYELALARLMGSPSDLHEQRRMGENMLIPITLAPIRRADHVFSRHRIVVGDCQDRLPRPPGLATTKDDQAAIRDARGTDIMASYTPISTTPLVWVVALLSLSSSFIQDLHRNAPFTDKLPAFC